MVWPGATRGAALERLRRSFPWLIATVAATLINPWGWGNLSRAVPPGKRDRRPLPDHRRVDARSVELDEPFGGAIAA